MTPEARKDQLLAQDVGDELVLYDERTHEAHRLNHTAALVWRLADGRRSLSEIAPLLHDALDVPDDEDFVRLALAELDRAGLLVHKLPLETGPMTRREVFKVAAYLLPAVGFIVVPTPAVAQFSPVDISFTVSPSSIQSGGSAQLSWNAQNATSVSIDQGIGVVGANGNRTVSPAATTTYTLTATGFLGAGVMTKSVTLTVTSVVDCLRISGTYTGNAPRQSETGNCFLPATDAGTVQFTCNGNGTFTMRLVSTEHTTDYSGTITGGGTNFSGTGSGTFVDSPPNPPAVCGYTGTVIGTISESGGVRRLNFTQTITFSLCCSGGGVYLWSVSI